MGRCHERATLTGRLGHRASVPTATVPRQTRRQAAAAASGKPQGVVTAIVAVTGVEDHVQDIIVPGAFTRTFQVRRPKLVFHHDWLRFLGRVLSVVELMPGDPRLPKTTKDGKPWPKEAGAVVAVMQFNLNVEAGRDGYEWARFYTESNECEWSVGYKVVPGKASNRGGVRYITDLDVFEFSLVLHGAASLSMTLDVKALEAARNAPYWRAVGSKLDDDVIAFFEQQFETKSAESAIGTGVMVALYPPADVAESLAIDDGSPADQLHVTLAYLGDAEDLPGTPEDLADVVRQGFGSFDAMYPTMKGTVGGLGQFPDGGDGTPTYVPVDVPGLSRLREAIVDAVEASPFSSVLRRNHGFTPHMTLGYDVQAEPVPSTDVTFDTVYVVVGDERIPVPLGASPETEGKALPKTQKCAKCKDQATNRVLWAEGMAYQPACPKHLQQVKKELAAKNGGSVDGVRDIESKSAAAAVLDALGGMPVTTGGSAFDAVVEAKAILERDDGRGGMVRRGGGNMVGTPGGRARRRPTAPATARRPAVRAAAPSRSDAAGSFDESKHKRAPAGDPRGGQFIAKGSGYKSTGRKDEAPDVSKAQAALIEAGFLGEEDGKDGKGDDGYFGDKTEAAVKKWQTKMGYKPTGKLSGAQFDELTEGEGSSSRGRRDRERKQDRDEVGREKYLPNGDQNPEYGRPRGQINKRPAAHPRPVGRGKPGPEPSRKPRLPVGRPPREFGMRTSDRSRLQGKSAWDTIGEARSMQIDADGSAHFPGPIEGKYDTSSLATAPGDSDNWLEQIGEELDPFIRAVAHALMRERGKSRSDAIRIAIGRMETWAAGGGDVTAKTRAKAAKAVAWWEKAKAKANATPNEGKSMYDLPGSYEQTRDLLRAALHDLFCKPNGGDGHVLVSGEGPVKGSENSTAPAGWVSIESTFPTYVIASWEPGDGSVDAYGGGNSGRQTFSVPYKLEGDTVSLGKPEPVTLRVVVEETGDDANSDDTAAVRFATPAAGLLDEATAMVMFSGASGKSAEVLRPALLRLLDALAVKGMPDVLGDDDPEVEQDDDEDVAAYHSDQTGAPLGQGEPEPQVDADPTLADDDPADLPRDPDAELPFGAVVVEDEDDDEDLEGKGFVVLDADEVARQLAELSL